MFEFIINEMIFKKKEEKERKKERKKNTVKYPIIASLRIFLALKT